ncbi:MULTISPECIES: hypothetical protein [Mycolicibacterium]|uniref:DUF3558 domain-containing protein n=2 Tax=Mycolicibacterium TaxID=1866885 RepID=A0ABT8HEJ9_MYCAO|nr:hypothetical protein [Mycolicibacterium austroafricanum]MDN4519190.1 hypothetical protein [Mycolicibacterium austroafricanum]QRZ07328.1 hypothetical protein JN090_01810 [Mycolicibacterium austroafricanum]QZT68987.1 hypothetical protein JN086_02800 [Mycolicibacterium austroafricanum]QZY46715.1 hypothetical protein K5L12_02770 [Mycolicibacterium austroafricanum]
MGGNQRSAVGRGIVLVALLVAAGCGGGNDEAADEPDCPSVTSLPPGTTPTTDPRCVERATERETSGPATAAQEQRSTWTGSFHLESTGHDCTSSYDGDARVEVEPGGAANGFVSADGSYSCAGAPTITETHSAPLKGMFTGDAFRLTAQGELGLATTCFLSEVTVPVEGDFASTAYTYTAPSGDVYNCRMTLDRAPAG